MDLVRSGQAASQDFWLKTRLSKLTLEQKVGQMMMAGFSGERLKVEIVNTFQRLHLGGVMLGEANCVSPEQVFELTNALQLLAHSSLGLPMLISIDQEGGTVTRLRAPVTVFPSAMALAATRSRHHAYACAQASAIELRTLGFNINFTPVLDVNIEPNNPVIGIRSFADDPTLVSEMGMAIIEATRESGLLTTAKHFPGHGAACVDSHLDLPLIERTADELRSFDLPPFQTAINGGVDLVMTAHAVYPALSSDLSPATMSPAIISHLLRGEMGFGGLVITDALVMDAVAKRQSLGQAAVQAILAGADIILTLCTLEGQVTVCDDVVAAVQSGVVPESMIDASVSRILKLKLGLCRQGFAYAEEGQNLANWPVRDHQEVAVRAARDAITLLRNDDGLLPLPLGGRQRIGLVEFANARFSPVESTVQEDLSLVEAIRRRCPNLDHVRLDVNPRDGWESVENVMNASDIVIVASRNAHQLAEQAAMIRRILELGCPTVVLALRNPYDLMAFPAARTYLVSYGEVAVSIAAAVGVLFGESLPRGKLPVAIPGSFHRGDGLESF